VCVGVFCERIKRKEKRKFNWVERKIFSLSRDGDHLKNWVLRMRKFLRVIQLIFNRLLVNGWIKFEPCFIKWHVHVHDKRWGIFMLRFFREINFYGMKSWFKVFFHSFVDFLIKFSEFSHYKNWKIFHKIFFLKKSDHPSIKISQKSTLINAFEYIDESSGESGLKWST
jgi:hypothetical protein